MITVISGTNRLDSNTVILAKYCFDYLHLNYKDGVNFINLQSLNGIQLNEGMYESGGQDRIISDLQDQFIVPSSKWLVISPEYNGSFPGILKLFIDALSARRYKETFAGKKAALIGVASGRAGNLRGMEHLTGLLNYLKVVIMPDKLPVSSVETVVDKDGNIKEVTMNTINLFLDEFMGF
jgi:chromate reductase, NAD(P)H dehydrogenase (quinone)